MIKERVKQDDPVRLEEQDMNVWIDASSLAIGMALEKNGAILEDVYY